MGMITRNKSKSEIKEINFIKRNFLDFSFRFLLITSEDH